MDCEALEMVESWGRRAARQQTDFYQSVQAAEAETVVLSWLILPSQEARAEGNAGVTGDPRLARIMKDMSVDGQRMFWDGFRPIFALGSAASST